MNPAAELKLLAKEANGIAKNLTRHHPKLIEKVTVGGGRAGIAGTVSNEWSHVANHWKPEFKISHDALSTVENFAAGHMAPPNQKTLHGIKTTIDELADLGALSKHPELRKSAHNLQAKLLLHEHQFHAPDCQPPIE